MRVRQTQGLGVTLSNTPTAWGPPLAESRAAPKSAKASWATNTQAAGFQDKPPQLHPPILPHSLEAPSPPGIGLMLRAGLVGLLYTKSPSSVAARRRLFND